MCQSTKDWWDKKRGTGGVKTRSTTKHTQIPNRNPLTTYLIADTNVSEAVGETVFVGVVVFVADFVAVVLDVTVSDSLGVWLSARVCVLVSETDGDVVTAAETDSVSDSLRDLLAEDVNDGDDPSETEAVDVPESDDPNVGENETGCVLDVDLDCVPVFVDVVDGDGEFVFVLD